MTKKLKILLTNDDGFYADGLQTLREILQNKASITIVAPDRERSAIGHGITMNHPLRINPVTIDNVTHWAVNGTPSDCVKLALENLLKNNPPDLLISGINRGPNMGNDILYSGTVSAAIEGTFYQVPSFAVSLAGFGKVDFRLTAEFISNKIHILWELAKKSLLNLNFPIVANLSEIKGVKFTKLGVRKYKNVFEERIDPRGQTYYWMGGEPVDEEQDMDSDIKAIKEGYISITPLNLNLTNYIFLENYSLNSIIF